MTTQGVQFPRFYVTAPGECPYIEGREERKVFSELTGPDASALNEALGRVGFRRSQDIAYRPACEGCAACVSVRILVHDFQPSKSQRRILGRNTDLDGSPKKLTATTEQFDLLGRYLNTRHEGGTMNSMTFEDYQEMVEKSPVASALFEYRHRLTNDLMGVALTDAMSDGLSMIYSFFEPDQPARSMGTWMILDHVERAKRNASDHVYLGYWVKESPKMAYKARFTPMERLSAEGWVPLLHEDRAQSD